MNTRVRKLRLEADSESSISEFARRHKLAESLYRSVDNGSRPVTVQSAKEYAKLFSRLLRRPIDWTYLMGEHSAETRSPAPPAQSQESVLVGEIGAGAEVIRFDEGVVLEGGIAPPPGLAGPLAARVKGDSMPPFRDGWLIFYGEEHRGVPDACLGKLCAVGLKDGTTLVKVLHKGSKRGLFDLESWNAPLRRDVPVVWASKVVAIRPV